jgi:allantoicase
MIDLISERVGGRVVMCNDEFFAEAANLLESSGPIANHEYTDRGKWMDGWETRRRREPGHDWCVVALGIPGRVRRVTVDTSYFTGNYPEQFSLDGAGESDTDEAEWFELIPRSDLAGDSVAVFDVATAPRVAMVRLNIFPDGGVARLRVEGEPVPDVAAICSDGLVDLASAVLGGEVIDASDLHYSHPSNVLRPTRSAGMWDGWETKRRRDQGHDWIVVRLGIPGSVVEIEADTTHFKGNAPGWVSVELSGDGSTWRRVVDRTPVEADRRNRITVPDGETCSHLRLSIHPDGGFARLRVMGRPEPAAAGAGCVAYLNSLTGTQARRFFEGACGSSAWAETMAGARPFSSVPSVLATAETAFDGLSEDDWLEAFGAHPRIGERGDMVANREQSGTATASRATLRDLVEVNRRYEEKHGFTFIVYATGKTAEEMLEIARERHDRSRDDEIVNAAGEQRKITRTRLARMLCQEER